MRWWQRLWGRARFEHELDAELGYHLDREIANNRRLGLPDHEARRQARLEVGGLDQLKEACRDARGTRWAEETWQDLRLGITLLRRHGAFTAVASLALGAGIGVTTMFFTVVNATTMRGLPIDDPERVVHISTRDARARPGLVSYQDFTSLRRSVTSFAHMAAFTSRPCGVGDAEHATERFQATYVSAATFGLLGVPPQLGRDFHPRDDRPGAPRVVMLGHRVWEDRYDQDPAIVDRIIRVNGQPATVIGVMPDGFRFPATSDVWLPVHQLPDLETQARDHRIFDVVARFDEEATIRRAQQEMRVLDTRLARDDPKTNANIAHLAVLVNDRYSGGATEPVWVAFMSAGVLVLLVACANVSNLLLMRLVHRTREMALRTALGASRLRVIRQLLSESTLLAVTGGVLGLGAAFLGLHLLQQAIPENTLPYWLEYSIDARVLTVMTVACLGTVFVFGLVPALSLSRTHPQASLRDAGRTATPGRSRWTTGFQVAQFGLTLVLLTQLLQGLTVSAALQRAFTSVDPDPLLTVDLVLPGELYETPVDRIRFYDRVRERVAVLPAIASSAIAGALPGGGAAEARLTVEGRPPVPAETRPVVWTLTIDGTYFDALNIPLRRGRAFTDRDGTVGQETAIVNQRFVDVHLPGEDPLGRRIQLARDTSGASPPWVTIVGVAPTLRQRVRGLEPDPVAYLPLRADPPARATLLARSTSDPTTVTSAVRGAIGGVDPDLAQGRALPLEQALAELRWNGRVSNAMIFTITLITLGLSSVGLYAVTMHSVSQRLREIGVRIALGAGRGELRRLVLRGVMRQLIFSTVVGAVGILAWTRLIGPDSPDTVNTLVFLVLGVIVLAVVSVAASLSPLRHATRVDPMNVLRWE